MANGKPGRPRKVQPPAQIPLQTDDISTRLADLVAELGPTVSEFMVKLSRIENGAAAYVGRLEFTPDLLDTVQQLHGGGRYHAAVADQLGKIRYNLNFAISGPTKTLPSPAVTEPASPAADPTSRLEHLIEKLVDRLGAPATPVDPFEQFKRVAEVIKSVSPAVQAAQPGNMLDQLGTFMEFEDRMRDRLQSMGGDGEESGLKLLVREGIKPTLQLLSSRLGVAEPGNNVEPAAPPAAAAAAEPAASPAPPMRPQLVDRVPPDADPILRFAADIPMLGRKYLLDMAQKNVPAEEAATAVLDVLSDDAVDDLAEQVDRPDFVDVFTGCIPNYRPHREWFGQLVAVIRARFAADDTASAEAETGEDAPAGNGNVAAS